MRGDRAIRIGGSLVSVAVQVPRVWGDRRLLACAVVAVAIVGAAAAALSRPPAKVAPVRAPAVDSILAQVAPADPALAAQLVRARGGDRAAAVEVARRYIDEARRTADPRHYGRAQAVLARWWTAAMPPDDVLILRATIRQAIHEFAPARRDLDALVSHRPDDLQARLTRAAVATVMGDLATAAADCDAAARAGDLIALACAAPLAATSGNDRDAIATDLEAALAQEASQPAVAVWAWASVADLARQRGDDAAAERAYRRALALEPTDTFALTHFADLLLDHDRAAEVARMLGAAGEADGVLLRLAIALHRTKDPAAGAHARVVRSRLAAGIARGDASHGRELGWFRLHVEGDAAGALAAGLANWEMQKEPLDARLVIDAARAAGRPDAARGVIAWLDAHQVRDAVLDSARARLGGSR